MKGKIFQNVSCDYVLKLWNTWIDIKKVDLMTSACRPRVKMKAINYVNQSRKLSEICIGILKKTCHTT